MDKTRDRWILAAGGGICAILIVLNVQLMFSNTRQLHDHAQWVSHTRTVISGLQNVLSLMKDAETGQRGYLLTGDRRYLEPYDTAVVSVDNEVRRVEALISDNPTQLARLPELKKRIARRLELLAENISVRDEYGLEPVRQNILHGKGKTEMDAVRALTAELIREEEGLLAERSVQAQRSYRWALASGLVAGVAALAAVIAFVFVLQRYFAASANAAAVIYNQRELLRITLASIGDAIITTGLDGRVTYMNVVAEKLTGWKQSEAAGVPLEDVFNIVNEDTHRTVENPAMRALREGVIVGLANHTVLISKDGEQRPIDDSASPIRDEANEIVGCVLVFRDVTERREAERQISMRVEQLAEGDRRKDEFLATLAHELRNPLAPLSNAMAILKMAGDDGQLFARTREMMERQLHQLVRLIDDLLDVSRISRGKVELRIERTDLASAIRHAVEACRPVADAARQAVAVSLPEEPIYLNADSVRLTQVFSNLISNACKFTPAGGHIHVAATVHNQDVSVSVRDDGIGIPPDKLNEVFDLFAQIDVSLERAHGGLGIGLTLVRRLVGLHGGTVVAHSDGPGRGSVFTVRLPLAAQGRETFPGDGQARSATGPAAAKGRKVLVVDDNEDSAESLALFLRLAGNDIRVAHDGLKAIREAGDFQPDIVFLDIGLPGLNGYEVAQKIRDMPLGARVTLVALTGWGQEEDRRKSKEAGFDHHLVKPVNPEDVATLIAQASAQK